MADFSLNILIITLNINGLNIPIKDTNWQNELNKRPWAAGPAG